MLLFFVPVQAQTDTLEGARVRSWRVAPLLKGMQTGGANLSAPVFRSLPNAFGGSDPLRAVAFLPGVQTSSELDLGVHVMGAEASQTMISIGDAPVYGAKHLLGLFSAFNPDHFESLSYDSAGRGVSRLGGRLSMNLPSSPDTLLGGNASLSPLIASANLRVPLSGRSSISLGLRHSLYIPPIGDALDLDYGFGDLNISCISQLSSRDELSLSFYCGRDNGMLGSEDFFSAIASRWGNLTALATWQHDALAQSLYFSDFFLRGDFSQQSISFSLPSGISSAGYTLAWNPGPFNMKAEAVYHDVRPLTGTSEDLVQKGLELAFEVSYPLALGRSLLLTPGLRSPVLLRGEWNYICADPYMTLLWTPDMTSSLKGEVGIRHQFLSQTGFAGTAMPLEFWLLPGEYSDPQGSLYASADCIKRFGRWQLSVNAYVKRLSGQLEYTATPVGLLSGDWALADNLLHGDGFNYGGSLMLSLLRGPLTGWLNYAYGRSLRFFPSSEKVEGWFSSSHERIHEADAVLLYRKGRIELSADMILASGTPFTPITSLYYASGRVMAEYGEFNSARLPAYFRVDAGVNWNCFEFSWGRGWLNFSLYNALNSPNYYSWSLHASGGELSYRPNKSFLRLLPTVGFRLELL